MNLQAELEKKTKVIAALTETNDLLLAQNIEKDITIIEEREKSAAEIRKRDNRIVELEGGKKCLMKQLVGTLIELNDEKQVRLQEQDSLKKKANDLELQVTGLETQLKDVERRKEKEIKELNENLNETRLSLTKERQDSSAKKTMLAVAVSKLEKKTLLVQTQKKEIENLTRKVKDSDFEIEELIGKCDSLETSRKWQVSEYNSLNGRNIRLEFKLEKMKSAGLWKRLLKKW